jgi:hypothetical protein
MANTLVGGSFQDSAGNYLANGWIVLELSAPAKDLATQTIQVCNSASIKLMLDEGGSIVQTPLPYIWANNLMLPQSTYYTARVYSSRGQLAWGPNVQYIEAKAGTVPIDITTWVTGNPA